MYLNTFVENVNFRKHVATLTIFVILSFNRFLQFTLIVLIPLLYYYILNFSQTLGNPYRDQNYREHNSFLKLFSSTPILK